MLTTSLGWLAVLAPVLSRASPVTIPTDKPALEKRIGNVGSFAKYFPDCSTDPSYATGISQYKDGEGVYVSSSCDNGMWTAGINNQFHCWTDLFVVNSQASYANWQNSGQVIDCSTTSSCSEVNINLNSTCHTDSTTWDNKFGTSIEAQIPLWFNKDAVTTSLTYDHSFGGANEIQMCTSESDTGTCTWNDQKCHAIWSAKRNIQVNGYLRRSCNTPRSGTNVPNSQKRPDGYYTVGMQDFNFEVPDNRIIGCAADCGDQTYPDPTPGSGPVTPIPSGT